jgi:hypothetical protein
MLPQEPTEWQHRVYDIETGTNMGAPEPSGAQVLKVHRTAQGPAPVLASTCADSQLVTE